VTYAGGTVSEIFVNGKGPSDVKGIEWVFGVMPEDPEAEPAELVPPRTGGEVRFDVAVSLKDLGEDATAENQGEISVRIGEDTPEVKRTNVTRDKAIGQEKTSAAYAQGTAAPVQETEGLSAGDEIFYLINVTNSQPSAARIEITDTIPLNTEYVEGSVSGGNYALVHDAESGAVKELRTVYNNVPSGGTVPFSFRVRVLPAAYGSDAITNTARVKIGDNEWRDTNTVEDAMGAKSASVSGAAPGEPIAYTIRESIDAQADRFTVWDLVPYNTVYDVTRYDPADYPDVYPTGGIWSPGPAHGVPAYDGSEDYELAVEFYKLTSGERTSSTTPPASEADITPAYEQILSVNAGNAEDVDLIVWKWTAADPDKPFEAGTVFEARFTARVSESATLMQLESDGVVNRAVIKVGDGGAHETNTVRTPLGEKTSVFPDKTGGDEEAALSVGDKIDYAIKVKNNSGAAADIIIRDTVPAGTRLVAGSAGVKDSDSVERVIKDETDAVSGERTLTWTFEKVPANNTVTAVFSVAVTADALTQNLGEIGNTAYYKIGANGPETETNTVRDPLGPKQTATTGAIPGSDIGYALAIPVAEESESVVITDKIPAGTAYSPGTVTGEAVNGAAPDIGFWQDDGDGDFDPELDEELQSPPADLDEAAAVKWIVWTWSAPQGTTFPADSVFRAGFTVTVDPTLEPSTAPDIENKAEYKVGDDDPKHTNTAVTAVTPEEKSSDYEGKYERDDSGVYKKLPDGRYTLAEEGYSGAKYALKALGGVAVGDEITYTVTYVNKSSAAQLVTVTDPIPEHTQYVAHSATRALYATGADGSVIQAAEEKLTDAADTDNYALAGGVPTWSGVTVPAGQSLTVTFRVRVLPSALLPGSELNNAAEIAVDGAEHTTNAVADELGAKQSSVDINTFAGDEVTYTISFEVTQDMINGEAADVTADITVSDAVPANTEYVPGSATLLVTNAEGGAVIAGPDGKALSVGDNNAAVEDDPSTDGIDESAPDDGYIFETGGGAYANSGRGTAVWTLPGRAVGDVITVTFKAKVLDSAVTAEKIENEGVVVSGDYPEVTSKTNKVTDKVEPDRKTSAIPGVTQGGRDLVVGDTLRYTIRYENTDTVNRADMRIIDPIPLYTAFKGSAGIGVYLSKEEPNPKDGYVYDEAEDTYGNGYVEWRFTAEKKPEQGSSGSVSFDVVVLQDAWEYAELTNSAVIIVDGARYTTNVRRDAMAVKQADAPADGVTAGTKLTYRISYETQRDSHVVRITDSIPERTVYIQGSARQFAGDERGEELHRNSADPDDRLVKMGYPAPASPRLEWEFAADDPRLMAAGVTATNETTGLPYIPAGTRFTVRFEVTVTQAALDLGERDVIGGVKVPASHIANYAALHEKNYAIIPDADTGEYSSFDKTPENEQTLTDTNSNLVVTRVLPNEKSSNASQTSPDGLIPGKVITYTIAYKNYGSSSADVVITDLIPYHTAYVAGSATWQAAGRDLLRVTDAADGDVFERDAVEMSPSGDIRTRLRWTVPGVLPGGTGSVTFQAEVLASAVVEDAINNTASIRIGENDPHTTNTVSDPMGDKQAKITGENGPSTYVYIGDEIIYAVKFRNNTTDTLNYTITDAVPSYTTYKADTAKVTRAPAGASVPPGAVTAPAGGKGTITWLINNVPPGGEGEVEFAVTVDDDAPLNTPITHRALIHFESEDGFTRGDEGTNTTENTVRPKKTYNLVSDLNENGKTDKGDRVRYTVSYTVTGARPAEVVIVDQLPEFTELVPGTMTSSPAPFSASLKTSSGPRDGHSYAGGNRWEYGIPAGAQYVEWVFSNIAPGTLVTVSFLTEATESLPPGHEIINIAWVNGQSTNPSGPPPGGGGGDIEIIEEDPPLGMFTEDHYGYVVGYPDGTVRPGRNITRAESATVLFRMLRDEVRAEHWTQENPYPDVQIEDWFNNAISVMNDMGTIYGYPDGTFKPNGNITRAELAALIARFARQMDMQPLTQTQYGDIAGHWAEEDIMYASSIGWLRGYPDDTFRPNQNLTRAEFMAAMNRVLERGPETPADLIYGDELVNEWPDNADPDAWYYLDVQEATNSHEFERKETGDPSLGFNYETWIKMLPMRDWAQFEREWSTANSAENPGDIMGGGEEGDGGMTGLPPGLTA
jgi:uncharacterized repeat protein (TIGR01451 family)